MERLDAESARITGDASRHMECPARPIMSFARPLEPLSVPCTGQRQLKFISRYKLLL